MPAIQHELAMKYLKAVEYEIMAAFCYQMTQRVCLY